jgi:hypothetical protein
MFYAAFFAHQVRRNAALRGVRSGSCSKQKIKKITYVLRGIFAL